MTGWSECRYYGRDFTAEEMALLRALIAVDPHPTRAALSREFCRRIGWFKPDGGLKDMMARVTMLAMHRDGVIALPPPKGRQGRPRPVVFGPHTEPPLFPAPTTLDEVRPLDLRTVVRGTREEKIWNEFVEEHEVGVKAGEASRSEPTVTLAPRSSMARTGAMPEPRRRLLPGLWVTEAPASACGRGRSNTI